MTATGAARRSAITPSVRLGVLLYLGYLAVVFATWAINGVDYTRIGQDSETTRLWYALPTLFGCAFLVCAITVLGWWRMVLFDRVRSGPAWVWVLPVAMAVVIGINFLRVPAAGLPAELFLWSFLGAIGVGFGEEVATRGAMIVGLRSRFHEGKVWLLSTLAFSALHVPNVLFGLPLWAMPAQVALTFIMGSGFYAIRRVSGTLILPMVLHGLWDSALFLNLAAGVTPSGLAFLVYPVAIACAAAVVVKNWNSRLPARTATMSTPGDRLG